MLTAFLTNQCRFFPEIFSNINFITVIDSVELFSKRDGIKPAHFILLAVYSISLLQLLSEQLLHYDICFIYIY